MKRIIILSILFFSLTIFGKTIVTTINPYYLITKEIVQDKLNVQLLVKPGSNPHTFSPTVNDAKLLSKSSLIVANGLELDNVYLKKYKNVLYLGEQVPKKFLVKGEESNNRKEKHAEHAEEYNPHVWLSLDFLINYIIPSLTKEIAKLDPINKNFYEKNSRKIINSLKQISEKFDKILKKHAGSIVIQEHPSFVYFFNKYNIKLLSVEEGHGKQPSAQHIKFLIESAKKEKLIGIFVGPQFDVSTINLISKEIGRKYYVLDGLGFSPKIITIAQLFETIYKTVNDAISDLK